MAADPFAFLRGSAAIMAADLVHTPTTGIRLQCGGDCHLANFGAYAAPDGTPVFDINDFDETLPAPFEWDVKRLAASFVVAGRVASMPEKASRKLARKAARAYREHIAAMAGLSPLEAWSSRIDFADAIADVESRRLRCRLQRRLAKVLDSGAAHFGLVEQHGGLWKIRDKPPLVFHLNQHDLDAQHAFTAYAETLQEDRRVLLQRYRLHDVAFKVVGVGSVGTFCAILLLVSSAGAPLLLQIKQAQPSVLGPSAYDNQGERVVVGQRMMQAATDVFLGWTRMSNRDFYVRRLKDSRLADIGTMFEEGLPFDAALCGRTLARAHARAGDAPLIAEYLGSGPTFEKAIADFALAYADQTERDWQALRAAIATKRLPAQN
jgi:uncharacterized protein (DUF2252 family)